MSVRLRKGIWYVRFQFRRQKVERSVGQAASKEDAKEFEAKLRRDLVANELGRAPKRTLDDAILKWLQVPCVYLVGFVKRSTWKSYSV